MPRLLVLSEHSLTSTRPRPRSVPFRSPRAVVVISVGEKGVSSITISEGVFSCQPGGRQVCLVKTHFRFLLLKDSLFTRTPPPASTFVRLPQFNALDTNGSGTITYEAMRMGLANLGTYSDVNYLMRRVSMQTVPALLTVPLLLSLSCCRCFAQAMITVHTCIIKVQFVRVSCRLFDILACVRASLASFLFFSAGGNGQDEGDFARRVCGDRTRLRREVSFFHFLMA